MPEFKRSDVEEIRLIDRHLEDGTFESTCYIKARGQWFKETRHPIVEHQPGEYRREDIISEFLNFQFSYTPCGEPGGF